MKAITLISNTLLNVHPMHSITVHFPIALSATALLFVLLALWQRNEALERAAFYNMILVPPGTLIAGLTGYRDHLIRFDGDAPFANLKIFLAITLLVLTLTIVISRWRQPELLWRPATMILYLSAFVGSFGLAVVLGFFGGVILYGF